MALSSDEGEISDAPHDLKASSLQRAARETGVDRRDRHRDTSPENDTASRHSASSRRSRSPRGYKRSRDDREYNGRRGGYDDRGGDRYHRPRVSYDDLDDDRNQSRERDRVRDRYPDKRQRNRSRTPDRDRRAGNKRLDRFVRGSSADRYHGSNGGLRYDDDRKDDRHRPRERRASGTTRTSDRDDTRDARPLKGAAQAVDEGIPTETRKESEPEPDYAEPEPVDEEAEIERRRKRREEILAKSSSATPLLLHAVGAGDKVRGSSPALNAASGSQMDVDSPQTPRTPVSNHGSPLSPASRDEPSPGGIDLSNESNLMNKHNVKDKEEDGPSAADYDPTVDMKEDERRDELRHGQVVLHGEVHQVVETTEQEQTEPQKTSSNKVGNDEDDDDFDMFAEDFDEDKYATTAAPKAAPLESADAGDEPKGGILEGDDKDGYYKMRVGEILSGRYQVQATLGKGMFSNVLRAVDITTKKLVAIKVMRNNDALRKGGYTEIAILEKLNSADPEDRKHIIKFERHFDYRGHLCMVFENLSLNLREVLRKFGNNVGINLGATRTYAYQIFVSLAHMRKCSIVHADLKPDNILVNEGHNVLKICDLGTAIDKTDAATAQTSITPYLVSRFYRAPEIILGMPYDYGVDMWSIGCTLYELYTGKILFAGDSNNQMLKAIMDVRGRITPKLYKRGQLSAQHFDEAGQFISIERDRVLGKTNVKTLSMAKPSRDLRTRLMAASTGMAEGETRELHQFINLLEQCLALNPDKRLKPADALRHPFFTTSVRGSSGRK
ncbi:kinase-like domain-containing protein [Emericellopsis atlantica]|uniref:non-specific serine/threonine protein kinase n=1 Tax=Emericellopsis atlantica TaxID=2614577 RepID=A0A9P7ZL23_9HYPO|nr:kinase-like domain-containing protein [Emericellopsis atlantica]KAG9253443.1 kinase-like domain-containing protein [Emericellopsis atlantica]